LSQIHAFSAWSYVGELQLRTRVRFSLSATPHIGDHPVTILQFRNSFDISDFSSGRDATCLRTAALRVHFSIDELRSNLTRPRRAGDFVTAFPWIHSDVVAYGDVIDLNESFMACRDVNDVVSFAILPWYRTFFTAVFLTCLYVIARLVLSSQSALGRYKYTVLRMAAIAMFTSHVRRW
jgi:hypothetical protein